MTSESFSAPEAEALNSTTSIIPSSIESGQPLNIHDRLSFWDAPTTISFFKKRGYILYERLSEGGCGTVPIIPSAEDFVEGIYPYASYDNRHKSDYPLLAEEIRGKVAFAQDVLGRHVAIKLVRDGTDECRVLRFLQEQRLETLQENCVIPVLEVLPTEGFCFVVMPRWGASAKHPKATTVVEVLDFMHAMLKGLSFLHERNIYHGDINDENVLISHFCDARTEWRCDVRQDLRSRRLLSYALFDFDFSILFPRDIDRRFCRLPYERSWGTFCLVYDTAQGEFDFNPFVFEVGNLGVTFCDLFQRLTPSVPFLAPLLDMMITRDLKRRFTASEALRFFEENISQMSALELEAPLEEDHSGGHLDYDEYDRWKELPLDLQKQWAMYREPPIPRTTVFLHSFEHCAVGGNHCPDDVYQVQVLENGVVGSPSGLAVEPGYASPGQMKYSGLQIPASVFQPGQDSGTSDRLRFWDLPETLDFFEDHGYTLYERVFSEEGDVTCASRPLFASEGFVDKRHPYASYDYASDVDSVLLASDSRARVAFAQDSLGRHVAIKLVPNDTDEYRILRFLYQQPPETLQASCIIPVLDLLPVDGHWFAVMPRWGGFTSHPQAEQIIDVLDFMHSALKALSFLHSHNISHGDINTGNVLVDHFCDTRKASRCKIRRDLRSRRALCYALFDFDLSIMLPPDSNRTSYRRSYEKSWGSFCKVFDTAQGEFDFNPFVFDVGNMGVMFCELYQHLTPAVPFLAPLLDRMTTRNLDRRFTASESLQFFERMIAQLPEAQLRGPFLSQKPEECMLYDEFDRWRSLPPSFCKEWAIYRESPVPLATKFLRWLCRPACANHIVAHIRWFSVQFMSFPRTSIHLVGLGRPISYHIVQRLCMPLKST
ncbi:hypothetical protein CVT26_004581 [Gymnopilus dilepis]|uniref:Protein kinase domain-containing protein n=1 Tax=Gymnopilus dilepis TaxID=231916 RepID=A0A409YU06_9AGAR|nr:hypothetical protein CVT26_004581 [Gymnopilus dilepis]